MSMSYNSPPPQAPPWRVAGLLCFALHMFLMKLASDDKHAKTDFLKKQELTVQACGRGSIAICTEAKMIISQFGKIVYR
jgi:hypothetical protein